MNLPPLGWCQRCHSPPAAGRPGWSPERSGGSDTRRRWMRWRGAVSRSGRHPGPPSVELQVYELGWRISVQHCQSAQSLGSASTDRKTGTCYDMFYYQDDDLPNYKLAANVLKFVISVFWGMLMPFPPLLKSSISGFCNTWSNSSSLGLSTLLNHDRYTMCTQPTKWKQHISSSSFRALFASIHDIFRHSTQFRFPKLWQGPEPKKQSI